MAGIDLLRANLGLADVMPPVNDNHLPDAGEFKHSVGEFKQNVGVEGSLDELFDSPNIDSRIIDSMRFEPSAQNRSLMQQGMLTAALGELKNDIQTLRDPAIRIFVRDILEPMLEDQRVLDQYLSQNRSV